MLPCADQNWINAYQHFQRGRVISGDLGAGLLADTVLPGCNCVFNDTYEIAPSDDKSFGWSH